MRALIGLVALVPLSSLGACSKSPAKKAPEAASSDHAGGDVEAEKALAKPVTRELSAEQQGLLFDSPVDSLQGQATSLASFKGKSLLLVNVASECGLTPQYAELQALQSRYADSGFTVVGFPSNQFGGQEPGTPEEILAFGKEQYGVSFPLMQKLDVNGEARHPIYSALTATEDEQGQAGDVQWNFEKFFVSRDGSHITRLRPERLPTDPAVIELIEADLAAH